MLTNEAIVQAFDDHSCAFPGSCALASRDASQWLMKYNMKYNTQVHHFIQPDVTPRECTSVYKLVEGCIWQHREDINRTLVSGGVHYILPCQLGKERVFIDWSLDQFKSLPKGSELLLYM
jgi:hypothetical protein